MSATPFPRAMAPADTPLGPLLNRVARRYLPLLFLCYVVSIIDRVNIGFAKLQMQQSLAFSDVVYGLGAGVFFIGYFLFEVPSNMLLVRVGARRWLARILVMWGPAAAGMAFVETPLQFYVLRFVLGVFEAGFFPGVVLLLTYWFPHTQRTRYIAFIMLGMPVAGIINGPLSAAIMTGLQDLGGMAGWQWLFILQGMPALLLGVVVFFWLDDKPASARWLSAAEIAQIQRAVGDVAAHAPAWRVELKLAFSQRGIWTPILAGFCLVAASSAFGFWAPQFLRDILSTDIVGVAVPISSYFAIGTLGMLGIGVWADRTGRRETILVGLLALGAASFAVAAWTHSLPAVAVVSLGLGAVCYLACFPVFWGCVTPLLAPAAAAAAIALINSVSNLGGALGPALVGPAKSYGGLEGAIAVPAVFMGLAALAAWRLAARGRG